MEQTRIWRPVESVRGWLLWAPPALLAIAAAGTSFMAAGQPIGPGAFGLGLLAMACLAGAILVGAMAWGYRSVLYEFTPDALLLRTPGGTTIIPYAAIDGIYLGKRLGLHLSDWRLKWPGYLTAPRRTRTLGILHCAITTAEVSDATVLATSEAAYLLSPARAEEFRRYLIARVEHASDSSTREVQHISTRLWSLLASDPIALSLLMAALAVLATILAVVFWRFETLPDLVPLHFDAAGRPDLIGLRSEVFRIPAVAAIILLTNLALGLALFRRERLAVWMLWATAILVQSAMLVAIIRIIGTAVQ